MFSFITSLFSNGGVKSIENIAKEWIDTPQEKAKAAALMVKTLDPNGMMRRNISQKVSNLYVLYILVTVILIIMQSYGIGNVDGTKEAIKSLTDLFVPITAMFTAIVGASFGVQYGNVKAGK